MDSTGKHVVGLGASETLFFKAISMFRTAYSYVLEPRPHRRSLTWFGYDAAHGSYAPVGSELVLSMQHLLA